MSLMDPDRIRSFLIDDLLKGENIESFEVEIGVLIKNGFIESFKTEKYEPCYRIHRLTQNFIKLYRKKRREFNCFEIENKLLNVLSNRFVFEIGFHGIELTREQKEHVVSHVYSFKKNCYGGHLEFDINLELELNYHIFCLHTGKNVLSDYVREKLILKIEESLPKIKDESRIHTKIKILTYLAYYYHNENPLLASKYLDKVFEIPLNNLYMNNMIQKVVIYLIAKINHQNNRNNEALVKAEELLKKSRYDFYSKLFGLSLMIQIKCKLSQDEKAKSLYDELVMFYEKKKYDNEYYHAYEKSTKNLFMFKILY